MFDEDPGDIPLHSEATHRMFKIYFVLSTFLLGIGLAAYCILRIVQVDCEKFEETTVLSSTINSLSSSRVAVPLVERKQRKE